MNPWFFFLFLRFIFTFFPPAFQKKHAPGKNLNSPEKRKFPPPSPLLGGMKFFAPPPVHPIKLWPKTPPFLWVLPGVHKKKLKIPPKSGNKHKNETGKKNKHPKVSFYFLFCGFPNSPTIIKKVISRRGVPPQKKKLFFFFVKLSGKKKKKI